MGRKKRSPPTPEEYTAKITRYVKRRQKNQPVTINKHYLHKALKKISLYGVKVKRQHPAIEVHKEGGVKCLKTCSSASMQNVSPGLLQPFVLMPTITILISAIRKALLSQKWNYCIRLFDALLKFGGLKNRHLLYLLRLSFLILFNIEISYEKLDHFLTFTLSVRGSNEKIAFLRSLIELKKFSLKKRRDTSKKASSRKEASPESLLESEDGDVE